MAKKPFWQTKTLHEMTTAEWESLCDGCARCCLEKLEDEDTGKVHYTNIACRLLDSEACRCSDYENRMSRVKDCVKITPDEQFSWMPKTCAYRRLSEGKDLLWWHPLLSGDPETVHAAGISVRGRVGGTEGKIRVRDYQDYLVRWPMLEPNGSSTKKMLEPTGASKSKMLVPTGASRRKMLESKNSNIKKMLEPTAARNIKKAELAGSGKKQKPNLK